MKRLFFTLLVVAGALAFTSCQEDPTMDELVQDIELQTNLDPDDDKDPPGGGGSGSGD